MARLVTLRAAISSLLLAAIMLSGSCAQLPARSGLTLPSDAHWLVLPLENHSSNSLAGSNAQSMVELTLRNRGIQHIAVEKSGSGPVQVSYSDAPGAYRYAVGGTVSRWQYQGEAGRTPVVSLQLHVLNLRDGTTLWSSEKQAKGRGSASTSSIANQLVVDLLSQLNFQPASYTASLSPTAAAQVNAHSTDSDNLNAIEFVASNTTATEGQPDKLKRPPVVLNSALRSGTDQTAVVPVSTGNLAGKSTAIYYAANPPVHLLSQFDRVILEPDNIKSDELREFNRRGVKTYAYQSIGEVGPNRRYVDSIRPEWVVGSNTAWNSRVMDLQSRGWRQFLLARIDELVAAGYAGLFLDTMDSYQLAVSTEQQRLAQEAALVSLLTEVKRQHPQLALISNRGFEVLDKLAPLLESVAAESLYASWNNNERRYESVATADREWLLSTLSEAKRKHGLDIIAIDYLPTRQREQARSVAKKIASHGFIPWISTPGFDAVGLGLLEVVPREVLLIYDSVVTGGLESSEVHKLLATPLEYLGFVPVYHDLRNQALPAGDLKGRYAGVVNWFTGGEYDPALLENLSDWLRKQLEATVPVAFFGQLPQGSETKLMPLMGVEAGARVSDKTARVQFRDELIGFETDLLPRISPLSVYPKNSSKNNKAHLSYVDAQAHRVDLVVSGEWGGYALNPAVIDSRVDSESYWIIDPFAFLVRTLKLPDIPQPDVTTENGRRLWFAHIDGDALPSFAEMPGKRLGAEVIEQRILDRFSLPHTISIVEGEMTGVPAYADRQKRMFTVAKRIFARDDVEIASHSYSHPYKWRSISAQSRAGEYNLPIPYYRYSAEREVLGSFEFIDRLLAPDNKSTSVMLWTGDALPTEEALAYVRSLGKLNMNGGYTVITNGSPAMSLVTPMARPVGAELQVYAPIMNENVYTNEWRGPYDGFRRVIETLQLTDKPRRLKPANIYYHFYSGTKIAAVRALEEVYEWSSQQEILPVVASYYIKKVPDFRNVGVARYLDGVWRVSSLGNIKSLRVRDATRWPDITSSNGIIGSRVLHDGMYIHTDGADQVSLKMAEKRSSDYHLVSTNAVVSYWRQENGAIQFRLKGSAPVELELGGSAARLCQVKTARRLHKGTPSDSNTVTFAFSTLDTGDAILDCRT